MKNLKNQNWNWNKKIKIKKILFFLFWIFLIFITLMTLTRTTVIGQAVNDLFSLLFGWTQYIIILIILFLLIKKRINFKKKIFTNLKSKLKKREYIKIFWFLLNFYWILGLLSALIIINIQNISWHNYRAYNLDKMVPNYFNQWLENSIYKYKLVDAKDFFLWHNLFAREFDGGGILGIIIASLSSYLQIIGAIFLNVFSVFLMISYMIHNAVFFYFYGYEKKKKIRWNNLNQRRNYQIKTNILDEVEDQDITIELDTARKIYLQDNERENLTSEQIYSKQKKWLKKEKEEKIQHVELEINDEEDFSLMKKNADKKEINKITKNENWFEINQERKPIIKNDSEEIEKIIAFHSPTDDIFTETFVQNQEKENLNIQNSKINEMKITKLFQEYKVNAQVTNTNIGPRVTRYIISLGEGVKVQKILELEPELKMTFGTKNVRLEAPISGQSAVGIEVPNKHLTYVSWKSVVTKLKPQIDSLLLGIGKNVMGEVEIIKLEELPHLLIAGSTGGGKSICLLSIISSLIFQKTPQELKLLLIDPKRVELTLFKNIPHLLCPVINENKLVTLALTKILGEIEKRFKLLENKQVSNIYNYNKTVNTKDKMPFIIIIIDELADLILTYRKEIEDKIVRIGQIARAVGIFMIVATQRPSVDIITSLIKTNIPGRIAFSVTSHNDSRTILNTSGAEKLLGNGDLLFKMPGKQLKRIQGTWINKNDIEKLTLFWKKQKMQNFYWNEFINLDNEYQNKLEQYKSNELNEEDQLLYKEIKIFLKQNDSVSISLIQRRFNLGFNRAARIFEKLEKNGIISKNKDNKARKIIHENLTNIDED